MDYPWYEIVNGNEIKQGDIIDNCPVFIIPQNLTADISSIETEGSEIKYEEQNVIVMSQTCDMAKDKEKIADVLLCAIWEKSEINNLKTSQKVSLENARKGRLPGFHVLNQCLISGYKRDFRIVDFRRAYSLPLTYFRKIAEENHLRLLPPYREHLSQAFARFFMRVGLPVDIPPFKK
ncbi:MAG: hypothetical protein KAJ46_01225 [Sedimentisphaerales bacterium]|nr:hypothetical protein [Sedimentisphaerales bacterium]